MKPLVSFHKVTGLELTPIRHFTAEDRKYGGEEFWVRDVIVQGEEGKFSFQLFSSESAEALEVSSERVLKELEGSKVAITVPDDQPPYPMNNEEGLYKGTH